ncbi:major facilitator superfamily domain-containing protein [Peziza echinospora]|nr:major facilitator superfamily domain-containing protein [Peziza echinospora]
MASRPPTSNSPGQNSAKNSHGIYNNTVIQLPPPLRTSSDFQPSLPETPESSTPPICEKPAPYRTSSSSILPATPEPSVASATLVDGGDLERQNINSTTSLESAVFDLADGHEHHDKFEVTWDGLDDPQNPQNWGIARKGALLVTVAVQTLIVILYSTSFLSGSRGMMEDFGIEKKMTMTLGMTIYLFGLACGPLVLAPMSEIYGRRPVYNTTLGLFTILILPACLARNYQTILAVRFLAAFVGSVTICNAPGSLGDIFDGDMRSLSFSLYALAAMNGPVLGPLMGGFVFQRLGWRWLAWIVFIASALLWLIGLFNRETYAPILLRRKASHLRKTTGDPRYRSRFCPAPDAPRMTTGSPAFWRMLGSNIARPIIMGVTEPICVFWELYVAVIYGILYLCFVGYPIIFLEVRGWQPGIAGLAFLGIGVGTITAVVSDPLSCKIYNMHKPDPETGRRPPEARIAVLLFASAIIPLSLFWFAWTGSPRTIHYIWPILAGIPYGLGNTLIFLQGNNYLVECYDRYAASALAGNSVARSLLGGILPLVGGQMYYKLGPNWAGTLVACLALVLMPIPWCFYRWGKEIRKRSPMLRRLQEEKMRDEEVLREVDERRRRMRVGGGGGGGGGTLEKVEA